MPRRRVLSRGGPPGLPEQSASDQATITIDGDFSQLWKPEVQDQGVSRVGFFSGLAPWLEMADFCVSFLLCVSVPQSHKDQSFGTRATLVTAC